MTAHLPECVIAENDDDDRFSSWLIDVCICDRLRACEQRRDAEWMKSTLVDKYPQGYAAGVQAARDAVAGRLTQMGYDTEDTNPYLAAIDALKGEQT